MNKNIPHSNKLITSDEGWLQMQLLLDQRLPSKTKKQPAKWMVFNSAATIFVIILLCVSLQLDNFFLPVHAPGNMHTSQLKLTQKISAKILSNQNSSVSLASTFITGNLPDKQKLFFTENLKNSIPGETNPDVVFKKHIGGKFEIQLPQKQAGPTIDLFPNLNGPHYTDKKGKGHEKKSWNFYAGVGLNVNMNYKQRFQPYPRLEARYNVTPGVYFAIGLSAWSPVSTTAGGISKTLYMNDTVNNIRLYNEVTSYKHLQYADIPLSVGLNIAKHVSVFGGVQLSVLMSSQTSKTLKPYDYQMTNIIGATLPIVTGVIGGEQQYNVQPKKMDYRFITGLQYTRGAIAGAVTYQYSPNSAGNGSASGNNNLVSASLLFKIK